MRPWSTRAARSAPSATATPIPATRSRCAVALKTLEIYERDKIVEHVAKRVAPIFRSGCMALADHPLVGEARGVGLIGAHRDGRGQGDASARSTPSKASAPNARPLRRRKA